MFKKVFIKNDQIHEYPTRQHSMLHIPKQKTAL